MYPINLNLTSNINILQDIVLEELLSKQEHNETYLDLEYISLNVNLLIHLLNTHFIVKAATAK